MLKFLIIQTSFIGDVVLATALAEKLHQHFPDDRIDIVIRKGNESLFDNHPFIHRVWVWNKKQNKNLNLLKLTAEIRKEKYDQLINLQRFFSTGLLSMLSGAKYKRGFDKNPLSGFYTMKKTHIIQANGNLHEVERNQLLIADITDNDAALPRLYPSENDKSVVADLMRDPYICIAPGSVWFTKQYPETHWIAFLKLLPRDKPVYLLGALSDSPKCAMIIEHSAHPEAKNLSGKLSYLQSAALMQGAVMNYVNDSAPLHFASAMNAPVTAIFCSTVPEFGYGPLSDDKHIIQTTEFLACKPCGLHGYKKCPEKHFKCALTIPADSLKAIIYERGN